MSRFTRKQWMQVRVLIGVFLLNMSNAFPIFYGNLYAYSESYYRYLLPVDRTDFDPAWILFICLAFVSVGCLMADVIKFKLGIRKTVYLGILLYFIGTSLASLAVSHSVWATALSFGVLGMFGLGLVEIISYTFTSGWFPKKQGLAGSIVGASGSAGAILYNVIITTYINPDNVETNVIEGEKTYFSQIEIIGKVPTTFLILASMSLVTQIIGSLLVKTPEFDKSESQTVLMNCVCGKTTYAYTSSTTLCSYSSEDTPPTCPKNNNKGHGEKGALTGRCECGRKCSRTEIPEGTEGDKSPKFVLKSPLFYLLCSSLMTMSVAMLIVSDYYKFFAQRWIRDDNFLTFVGSSSAVSSLVLRIGLGFLIDVFGVKNVFVGTFSTVTIMLAFWFVTAIINKWLYFVWTNLLAGLTGSFFVLYPVASLQYFGITYLSTNTGLIMFSMTISGLITAPLVTVAANHFGWFSVFFIVSVFTGLSTISLTIFMPKPTFFNTT